jgi:hypothetical protein
MHIAADHMMRRKSHIILSIRKRFTYNNVDKGGSSGENYDLSKVNSLTVENPASFVLYTILVDAGESSEGKLTKKDVGLTTVSALFTESLLLKTIHTFTY